MDQFINNIEAVKGDFKAGINRGSGISQERLLKPKIIWKGRG